MQSFGTSCFFLLFFFLPVVVPSKIPSFPLRHDFLASPSVDTDQMLLVNPRIRFVATAQMPLDQEGSRSGPSSVKNYDLPDIFNDSMPSSSGQERESMLDSSASRRNSAANSFLMLSGSVARAIRFDDQIGRLILAHSQLSGQILNDGELGKHHRATRHSIGTPLTNNANDPFLFQRSSSTRKILMHRVKRPRVPVPPSGPSPQIHSEPGTR